jgi:hypothetical protein
MDIVAHMLWAGAGTLLVARHAPAARVTRRMAAATVGLAALPDLMQFVPLLVWVALGDGPWAALANHALALPGQEPSMPAPVALVSHHLHCIGHSAPIAAAVSAAAWFVARGLWLPLLGWWSHILIDVVTHSADFYAVPVLYPFSERGFDGIAWNEPWFIALNYGALALFWLWAVGSGRLRGINPRPPPGSNNRASTPPE